jgi:hypothetical protein
LEARDTERLRLKWVDDLDLKAGKRQSTVQPEPVVPTRLHGNRGCLRQRLQAFRQQLNASTGIGKSQRPTQLLTLSIQEARLVLPLADIYADCNHRRSSRTTIRRNRVVSEPHELSTGS